MLHDLEVVMGRREVQQRLHEDVHVRISALTSGRQSPSDRRVRKSRDWKWRPLRGLCLLRYGLGARLHPLSGRHWLACYGAGSTFTITDSCLSPRSIKRVVGESIRDSSS